MEGQTTKTPEKVSTPKAVCSLPQSPWKSGLNKEKWSMVVGYCELIEKAAANTNLDPVFLATVIFWESGGDSSAISASGAIGLMQVMPRDGIAASFMCINGPCFAGRPSIEELLDPAYNIDYGSKMLAGLINKYGSVREGLFKYGPMGVGYTYADDILSLTEQIRQYK